MDTHGNIETFTLVYSLISLTYTVSNVDIDIPMIKQENLWHRVRYLLEVVNKIFKN